jgi:phosphoglycolate phosphatase-like HAD superfamily hydrolase
MSPPAACLFDLDGLLLDTEPLHARAWQEAASRFGTNLGPTQLRQLRGRRRLDCAEQVLQWIAADGGRCEGADALLAVRQPIAEQLLALARPLPTGPTSWPAPPEPPAAEEEAAGPEVAAVEAVAPTTTSDEVGAEGPDGR